MLSKLAYQDYMLNHSIFFFNLLNVNAFRHISSFNQHTVLKATGLAKKKKDFLLCHFYLPNLVLNWARTCRNVLAVPHNSHQHWDSCMNMEVPSLLAILQQGLKFKQVWKSEIKWKILEKLKKTVDFCIERNSIAGPGPSVRTDGRSWT